MHLKPYQQTMLDNIRASFAAGHRGVIAQLMTGAGKTFLACHFIHDIATMTGGRILILVHRHELIAQWITELQQVNLTPGILAASHGPNPHPHAAVQIAMIQTLNRRNPFPHEHFNLLIPDECHLSAALTYKHIFSHHTGTNILGLTATPTRLDGQAFTWATRLINGPTHHQLVQANALTPFTTHSIDKLDYRSLKRIGGDYTARSQGAQFESQPLIGNVVDTYLQHAAGRPGITFASTIDHSTKLCAEYNLRGIPAVHLDGTTPDTLRDQMIKNLDAGAISQLCNVGVCTEGLNVRRVSTISIAFATLSIVRWRQAAGRALRVFPGKDRAIILDHGGNALRHGNLDYDHQWNLDQKTSRQNSPNDGPKAHICSNCAAVMPIFIRTCEVCGKALDVKERKLRLKPGHLIELPNGAPPVASFPTARRPDAERTAEIAIWAKTL